MNSAKEDTLEIIRTFLPKYLTPEMQENLFHQVKEYFPSVVNPEVVYFSIPEKNYFYQGDCVVDIPFAQFLGGQFGTAYMKGVVASNTCDISPENSRLDPSYVQFASVFSLSEYISILEKQGISAARIKSFLNDLKGNRISNLFYLPEKNENGKIVLEESFVRLDVNTSLPIDILNDDTYNKEYAPNGDRIFSFSNYGFYVFLLKLSIHYCRFREGVFRDN